MIRILLSTRLGERRWTQADLREPNSEPRTKSRTGAPIHSKK